MSIFEFVNSEPYINNKDLWEVENLAEYCYG